MSQIIAGLYEIEKEIGSGGGGIVYLGRHLRLEKKVVLKADRRTLSAKPEALRREVDMLKGLSHTYIPQVYDFVQQDGVVYTVMDFIDGESLDKILNRGELPTQPQVIQWACQILEALCYLHSRPPHGILHGDIKPANIMLRPNGDICLIDYNIALALGEDGAVKVGRSQGYASPEHYGVEYSRSGARITGFEETERIPETEWMDETKTMAVPAPSQSGSGSSTGSGRSVKLDVRSDLYSLGATLYHLLSGNRPAREADQVVRLNKDDCSPAVAAIVQKAMEPNPANRYQSAEEMLDAFRKLHKKDPRMVRHKRREAVCAVLLTLLFLAGGTCTFIGLKQQEQRQTALALAEYSADNLAGGNVTEAIRLALQAMPEEKSILNPPPAPQAQKALTDALGVYDLSEGFKALDAISLASAPIGIQVSPEGSRFAILCSGEGRIYDTASGQLIASLPLQDSALSDLIFADESRILYAGAQGVQVYDLSTEQILWTGEQATTLSLSEDGKTAAAVNRDQQQILFYQMDTGETIGQRTLEGRHMSVPVNDLFADPENRIFALNGDGSLLAVSFSDGGLWILDVDQPENDLIIYDTSDFTSFQGGFCGKYFAFAADKNGQAVFGLVDAADAFYVGGYESKEPFILSADHTGICLASQNVLVRFDPDTLEETELAYTDSANITGFSRGEDYVLVATDQPGFAFYDRGANCMSSQSCQENCDFVCLAGSYAIIANRTDASVRLMKAEDHKEALILSYDARYPHDEARISQDEKTVMLFSYENFRIYDREGNIAAQQDLPDPEHIYDQQFRREDGQSWLEVIWYDGTVRCYSAADGSLIQETRTDPPEENLYEEFFTAKYRITSPLHGAPQVYDRETGKLMGKLEEDAYLTYVTETGDYIITEYVTASGERYGLLLDQQLQTLADLPGLCDIKDGMAVFDFKSGNLRQSRLYSLQELKALGEAYLDEIIKGEE